MSLAMVMVEELSCADENTTKTMVPMDETNTNTHMFVWVLLLAVGECDGGKSVVRDKKKVLVENRFNFRLEIKVGYTEKPNSMSGWVRWGCGCGCGCRSVSVFLKSHATIQQPCLRPQHASLTRPLQLLPPPPPPAVSRSDLTALHSHSTVTDYECHCEW